ncbi:hypothetical protein C8T65DRAFT_827599 [Cerioporus squamosus]|nr:hypothetical protein C8T65DRAFT_827599 [Cerioporus squamosus]
MGTGPASGLADVESDAAAQHRFMQAHEHTKAIPNEQAYRRCSDATEKSDTAEFLYVLLYQGPAVANNAGTSANMRINLDLIYHHYSRRKYEGIHHCDDVHMSSSSGSSSPTLSQCMDPSLSLMPWERGQVNAVRTDDDLHVDADFTPRDYKKRRSHLGTWASPRPDSSLNTPARPNFASSVRRHLELYLELQAPVRSINLRGTVDDNIGGCSKTYESEYALKRHIQDAHLAAKFPCSARGTPFARPELLDKHQKSRACGPRACSGLFIPHPTTPSFYHRLYASPVSFSICFILFTQWPLDQPTLSPSRTISANPERQCTQKTCTAKHRLSSLDVITVITVFSTHLEDKTHEHDQDEDQVPFPRMYQDIRSTESQQGNSRSTTLLLRLDAHRKHLNKRHTNSHDSTHHVRASFSLHNVFGLPGDCNADILALCEWYISFSEDPVPLLYPSTMPAVPLVEDTGFDRNRIDALFKAELSASVVRLWGDFERRAALLMIPFHHLPRYTIALPSPPSTAAANTPTLRFAPQPRVRPSKRRASRALQALPYNGALRPRTRQVPDDAHNALSIIDQAERAQVRRKRHSSSSDLEHAALAALETWGPDVWHREAWDANAVEPDDSTRRGRRRRQPEVVDV